MDTGFGETINVARAIRELEDLGLCGAHLEDQVMPKRCGHLDHKMFVDMRVMVQKIRAAFSQTGSQLYFDRPHRCANSGGSG